MVEQQLLERRPAAAALGPRAAAAGEFGDGSRTARDLVLDHPIGDAPAVAHVHGPQVKANLTSTSSAAGPRSVGGRLGSAAVVAGAVVLVAGVESIVIFLIVTFLVGAPSPLGGYSCPIFWATSSPLVTVPRPA